MKVCVGLARCGDYSRNAVSAALDKVLAPLGGIKCFVRPGQTVLLKPNLLFAISPDRHITTHPEVVRALAIQVKDAGGRVWIGDSPGIGTAGTVANATGMALVAKEVGAEIKEFGLEKVALQSQTGYRINIAKAVVDADVVINIPKVKTHLQMGLTLGIKNCFGCIPGAEKSQWHFRAGIDNLQFCRMLVETFLLVKPALTVADGIWGLEGDGPSTDGSPRQLGFMAASSNALALDRIIMEILGVSPCQIPLFEIAKQMGAGVGDLGQIDIRGESIDSLHVPDFRMPTKIQSLQFNRVPKLLRPIARELFTAKPVLQPVQCVRCGKCFQACPANAITWQPGHRPAFAYDKCIRCFCCQEMCPKAAIRARNGPGLRIISPVRKLLREKLGF